MEYQGDVSDACMVGHIEKNNAFSNILFLNKKNKNEKKTFDFGFSFFSFFLFIKVKWNSKLYKDFALFALQRWGIARGLIRQGFRKVKNLNFAG